MKKWFIVLAVIVVLILIVYQALKFQYNRLVVLDQQVKESFAQVDNVLQRRSDLIPNRSRNS